MKNHFVVEQKGLLALLSSMQPICSKRTALDVTSSILFQVGHKELVLKGTDLEISLQASCPIESSDIEHSISFLVSGRRIFDLVKELDGMIQFSITDTQLLLESNSVHLALNIKDHADFPPFPERIENLMSLEASFLLNMLNKVAFIIPQNNANQALNGLFLEIGPEDVKMTATDGHCLAQVRSEECTLEENRSWLLPRRAVFEMKKILENVKNSTVFLGTCANQMVFSGGSFNFFTKLLSDPFPQYNSVLQRDAFKPASLDRSHFIKTLRRSSCLLSGQFIATTFAFGDHALKVSMQNKEVGTLQEEVPLHDFAGDTVDVRFYAPYLLNGLQAFSEDTIHFYLQNAAKPIIFESKAEQCNLLYLVMPVAPTYGS